MIIVSYYCILLSLIPCFTTSIIFIIHDKNNLTHFTHQQQPPMHQGPPMVPQQGMQGPPRFGQQQPQWPGQPRPNGPRPGPLNGPPQRPQMVKNFIIIVVYIFKNNKNSNQKF